MQLKDVPRDQWVDIKVKSPFWGVITSVEREDDNVWIKWNNGKKSLAWASQVLEFQIEVQE